MNHDYSGHEEKAAPEQMAQLNALVNMLHETEHQLETAETKVKELEARRRQLREHDIPELLNGVGLKDLTTTDGLRVALREEVRASFPKDEAKREQAFAYLKDTGNQGLVKHNFVVSFVKGQEQMAQAFHALLQERLRDGVQWKQDKTIHPQTLLAFLRRQLEGGKINTKQMEAFGAFVQKFANVDRSE